MAKQGAFGPFTYDETSGALVGVNDSRGNNSLVVADENGYPRPTGGFLSFKKAVTVNLIGDSILGYRFSTLAGCTIVNNGDGTANVTRTSHGSGVGDRLMFSAAPNKELNVMDAEVIQYVDANNLVVRLGGLTHEVFSTAGNAVMYKLNTGSGRSVIDHVNFLLGYPLTVNHLAVGGARCRNITQLIADANVQSKSDIAVVCIGMNNIYADGQSLAGMQGEAIALLAEVKRISSAVIWISVPPRDSTDSAAWTASKQTIHTQFNKWLSNVVKGAGGRFIDSWLSKQDGATYINSGATNPDPTASFMWNVVSDQTHPGTRGAIAMANDVYQAIVELGYQNSTNMRASHPAMLGADGGNLLVNAHFPTASFSSGLMAGYTTGNLTNASVTPTAVAKAVATDGNACGNWQRLSIYNTGGGVANPRFNFPSILSFLQVGKKMRLSVRVRITNSVGLTDLGLYIFLTRASGSVQCHMFNQDSNSGIVSGNREGWIISRDIYIPAGTTATTVYLQAGVTTAQLLASPLLIDVSEPVLEVVTNEL